MCSDLFSSWSACKKARFITFVEIGQQRAQTSKCLAYFKDSALNTYKLYVCASAFACMCLCESPSRPVSISLCVFTVATPKPSRSPVRHHNGPRKSIWRFETPKTISPLRPATLPPSTIIPCSRLILLQRHDRVRNHKEPISQEGITISPEDRRTNRNRAAYGEDLWGSGAGGWDMAVGRR